VRPPARRRARRPSDCTQGLDRASRPGAGAPLTDRLPRRPEQFFT